jgi:hypothetical protein
METDGHHTVSREEGFLNSVTMMHVDIDVEHTLVISEKF